MLFAHVVAATEGYLEGAFTSKVTSSTELIKRLLESDKVLAKQRFSLSEIYSKYNRLPIIIAMHLRIQIFHKVHLVKRMYKNVLCLELGDMDWFRKAVEIRHDCVHRAGYTKERRPVKVDQTKILELLIKSEQLVDRIESFLPSLVTCEDMPF